MYRRQFLKFLAWLPTIPIIAKIPYSLEPHPVAPLNPGEFILKPGYFYVGDSNRDAYLEWNEEGLTIKGGD